MEPATDGRGNPSLVSYYCEVYPAELGTGQREIGTYKRIIKES